MTMKMEYCNGLHLQRPLSRYLGTLCVVLFSVSNVHRCQSKTTTFIFSETLIPLLSFPGPLTHPLDKG